MTTRKENLKKCACGGNPFYRIGPPAGDTMELHEIYCPICGKRITMVNSPWSPDCEKDVNEFCEKWNRMVDGEDKDGHAMSYCDTCANKGTAVCLECKSREGVPDKYEPVICTEASSASFGRYGKVREETGRAYFAVSVKHSAYKWRFGKPLTLWGYKRTADGEPRCFGGYTLNPDCAELYAPGDFEDHGYTADIVKPEPVNLEPDFCRKYRDFDTVLVPAKDIYDYWRLCGLLPTTDEETAQ